MESLNVEERTDGLCGVDDAETNADLNQILTEYDHSLMRVSNYCTLDPLISTQTLHVKYVKEMEALGRIAEALRLHQMAKDKQSDQPVPAR